MKITRLIPVFVVLISVSLLNFAQQGSPSETPANSSHTPSKNGFTDAADFGFSPEATGTDNAQALQRAVDKTGTILVSRPGTYAIANTVYIGSHTSLIFGSNVFLKKVNEKGPFSHVILNKGALTKTFDQNITIEGLQIIVNGVDVANFKDVFGLRGQLAFFYVKDLRIERFRCLDLGNIQYCIHVCTFEDVIVDDVIIKGKKDGVHFGRGKRFTVRNGVFSTGDDAIGMNAHDYDTGNPELGWIEDGVVENCWDLTDDNLAGYFCRILAGAWIDWKEGMEVQKSDTVVSQGRLYRVSAGADGKIYKSMAPPTHETGKQVLDGITWVMVQNDVTYTAGVRNVIFRNIFLSKPRTAFSIHFDNDKYSRSYYPGAIIPKQEQIVLDNIRFLYPGKSTFLRIATPVDVITITNSSIFENTISFVTNKAVSNYLKTKINVYGCVFNHPGSYEMVENKIPQKVIDLKTFGNIELGENFSAKVTPAEGTINVDSDLTGLKSK